MSRTRHSRTGKTKKPDPVEVPATAVQSGDLLALFSGRSRSFRYVRVHWTTHDRDTGTVDIRTAEGIERFPDSQRVKVAGRTISR